MAGSGLPIRGDIEVLDFDQGIPEGLFLDTLNNVAFELQPERRSIVMNAKYLTSDIQNEFIDVDGTSVKSKEWWHASFHQIQDK